MNLKVILFYMPADEMSPNFLIPDTVGYLSFFSIFQSYAIAEPTRKL